jgi:Na+/H+ antiporter NhaC
MNFGRLMLLYSFTTPIGCGAKAGWEAHGWAGAGIGITIGLIVGLLFSYATACELTYILNHKELSKQNISASSQLIVIGMIVALIVQMFSGGFLSIWITEGMFDRIW